MKKRIVPRSGFEQRVMDNLKERKVKYEYETIKIKYDAKLCPHCKGVVRSATYTPDFIFKRNNSVYLLVESKGRFTAADRKKMQAVQKGNPSLNIRILLQKDERIGRSPNPKNIGKRADRKEDKRKTYGDWCERNGFVWAVGEAIPDEWIKG